MINFKRQQVLLESWQLESWQVEMLKKIAKMKDCSYSEALRFIICFTSINFDRWFIYSQIKYADLNFKARTIYERRKR